jgi:superfamily I DNA and/or RNA helicase
MARKKVKIMAYIRMDFGSQYNDISTKIANELEEKINDLLARFDMSSEDFFNTILKCTTGVYVSSSNMNRQPENSKDGKYFRISNFFFRLQLDDYAKNLLKENSISLKGNISIKNDSRHNFFEVKDFYLIKNTGANPYETFLQGEIDYRNLHKSDYSHYNDVLCQDLATQVPFIIQPKIFRDFINNWRSYLEFEKSVTIRNIKSYPVSGDIKFQTVSEVVDNATNREEFKNHILKEGNGNLYIDEKCPNLSGNTNNEVPFILLTVKVKKSEFGTANEKEIKNFAKQLPSIIGEKQNDKLKEMLDELKKTDKERRESGKELPEINGFEMDGSLSPEIKGNDVIFHFLVADESNYRKDANIEQEIARFGKDLYLAYIASGDIALYSRGKNALDRLEIGDVKNPYLAGLLIEPQKFENNIDSYNESNVKFALKQLNPSQKAAIIKCLNSNSIFCLQGPPGTGKTQTITELVYQYNKMGKKVLLSSQTHIAIDNVIERLPKELNILPIRLVRDRSKANKQYLPECLLDNLYEAAYCKYKGKIDDYNTYEKNVQKLKADFESHQALLEKIGQRLKRVQDLQDDLNKQNVELSKCRSKENEIEAEIKETERAVKVFEEYNRTKLPFEVMQDNYVYPSILPELEKLRKKYADTGLTEQDTFYNYALSFKRIAGKGRINHLNSLLQGGEKPQELQDIENDIAEINSAIQTMEKLKQDTTALRSEISKKLQLKKELDRKYENVRVLNISNEKFYFVKKSGNPKDVINAELDGIKQFLHEYNEILKNTFKETEYYKQIDKQDNQSSQLSNLARKIQDLSVSISNIKKQIEEADSPIKTEREKLDTYFNSFYTNELNGAALPKTEPEKFSGIAEYINQEYKKFQQFKSDFVRLQPIYESLSNYLESRGEYIKQQRNKFTKTLLKNNANVYGITCTSSPYFRSATMTGADDRRKKDKEVLEVEDVDIRKIDFDVVIIDEVSKATPIEMLIPIIYGKSVILVGDQRQLPPIFKYRDSMFEDVDANTQDKILQGRTLKEFKEMVEHSLFEEIFNKLKTNKSMLTQQYRFNEAIMKCVNVFYDGKLQLGAGSEQNNKKQHYLDVSIPNYKGGQTPIFCRNNSTYWFDSHKWDDGTVAFAELREGETSFRNALEVNITVELLLLLEKGYGELKKNNPEEYKMASGDGEKPSVAVISMYGKHINSIKNELSNRKMKFKDFKNISLDISTVDNYQGKEQDIVLVNMVANNKSGRPGEFLQKFNRINVAISRARTMLIMVGSSQFYNGVSINVPRMEDGKNNWINAYYRVYEQCQSQWAAVAGLLNIKKGGTGK